MEGSNLKVAMLNPNEKAYVVDVVSNKNILGYCEEFLHELSKVSVSVKEAYLVISSFSEGIRFRRNLDGEYTLVVE